MLKAVDTRHERLVALKVRVVPPAGSPDDLLTEARALLSLPPHPGLAHARDDLFDDGRHVLVLDWVEGVNLARLLADEGRPGLPVSSVLRWIAQAAEALTVLHQHGVVHGDVKPANLILDRDGRVVLVDLGSSSVPMTRGSARRDARASGRRRSPAGRRRIGSSDVFGLAATAFTLLTGSPPTGGPPAWDGDRRRRRRAARGGAAGRAVDRSGPPSGDAGRAGRTAARRAGTTRRRPVSAQCCSPTSSTRRRCGSSRRSGCRRCWPRCSSSSTATSRTKAAGASARPSRATRRSRSFPTRSSAVAPRSRCNGTWRTDPARCGCAPAWPPASWSTLDGDVLGPTVNRAARVRELARGRRDPAVGLDR